MDFFGTSEEMAEFERKRANGKVYINNHESVHPDTLIFWLMELAQEVRSAGRQDLIEAIDHGKLDQWLKSDRSEK